MSFDSFLRHLRVGFETGHSNIPFVCLDYSVRVLLVNTKPYQDRLEGACQLPTEGSHASAIKGSYIIEGHLRIKVAK
jgi:hypothetical protein